MTAFKHLLQVTVLILVAADASARLQCPDASFPATDGGPHRAGCEHAADSIPSTRAYELHELSASGILMDPNANAAYDKALGSFGRDSWLADLDGPSAQNRLVTVDGDEYILASACKNHDCAENNVVLLYSAAQGLMYGLIYQSGWSTLIGDPSPVLALALERSWREQFR